MPKRTVNFREQLLAEAKQMTHVAERAGVAREALYRMLNKSGNPTYNSLRGVLNALGIRMWFAPVEKLSSPRRDKKPRVAAGKSKYR